MKIQSIPILFILLTGLLAGCSTPEEKAAEHVANGQALLAENDLDKARVEFASALQLNQNLPEAWFGMARIHEQQGQWDKAYRILIGVRGSNPRFMDGRVLLTNILVAANRLDEAYEDARDIVELVPDDARSHAILAMVHFRLNNITAARDTLERALTLDPKNEDAILVQVRLLMRDEKLDDALVLLDGMLRAHPDRPSYYAMKLEIHTARGDKAAELHTYEAMVRQFPNNDGFQNALIQHHIEAGNLNQAQELLNRRIEQSPEDFEEKLRLARFLYRHRSPNDAIEKLEEYVDEFDDDYRFKFSLAETHLRENQMPQAIDIYDEIIRDEELGPNGLQARNVLARIHLLAGRLSEAKLLIDEVLEEEPNNQDATVVLARFNLAAGNQDDAINNLRHVLRDDPGSIEALTLLGQAQEAAGAMNLAIETLSNAYDRYPVSPVITNQLAELLIRANQPERADEVLWKSIRLGNESIDTLKLLTQVNLMLGNWEQAEQLAQRLGEIVGEEVAAQQALGLAYHGSNKADDSYLAFRRAYELNPDAARPVASLVKAYVERGESDKAVAFLKKVVADNPENTIAYHLLGQLSLKREDVRSAIGYFNKVIELSPESELGYLSVGGIYLSQGDFRNAEKVYSQGAQAVPGSLTLAINQALLVEHLGQLDRAIELYEQLLQSNPDVLVARNNLASLLTDHRTDLASHERARVLAEDLRDSKIALFRDTYAWTSVKLGLYLEEAISILRSIIRDNRDVGVYHYHLGEAYRKSGNSFEARRHLRKAIELEDPRSPVAIAAQEALKLVS